MNIVVSADGELGFYLTKLLSDENHNITVINDTKDFLDEINNHYDVLTINGDPALISTLEAARVDRADLFISVLHQETPNLLTAILAKKMGAKKTIARVSNTENLKKEKRQFYNDLGINNLVSPENIASKEIVRLLKNSAAEEIFDFSEGKLSLMLIRLDEKALVINKSLTEIAKENPNLQFRAVAVHRKGKTIIPNGNNRFLSGDLAYIITKPEGMDQVLTLGGKGRKEIKNVMIVGGGRIGRLTAKRLQDIMNIKLLEIDMNRCDALCDELRNTMIIRGDSRDMTLLEEEGISAMDAFISLTNDTETNILTCLLAKQLGVTKTIALVENIDYINIAQNVNIDTIINKKLIAASYIDNFTLSPNITSSKVLNGVEAEALEFIVEEDAAVTKRPIKNLNFPHGAIIGGIVRNNEGFIALGDFQIEANDRVVVFTLPEVIKKVKSLFSKR
ncbi:MAG: Trk system potassium transporter TrkA [Bacteroidales bacterium]|nr:Trk system potassium transporter TrkA [Bacteroidales bacterium]